jgi:hypothetical protein
MLSLCQFRDLFGVPGVGAHSLRVGPFALVDVLATWLLAYVLKTYAGLMYSMFELFIALAVIAQFVHYAFCVPTAGLRLLSSLNPWKSTGITT